MRFILAITMNLDDGQKQFQILKVIQEYMYLATIARGYYQKENKSYYHVIQMTEFDFEPRFNNFLTMMMMMMMMI